MNCCAPPVATEAVAGETVILVSTGGAVTVTLAVPLALALDAVTVNGPPTVLALNRPELLIVPPPLTVQANTGCVLTGWPN